MNEFDVIIVGGGPAGLSAALTCKEAGLSELLLEKTEIGSILFSYPKGKKVKLFPEAIEAKGSLPLKEGRKEEIISMWRKALKQAEVNYREWEEVVEIKKEEFFKVITKKGEYFSKFIVLAIGVQGMPQKLGIPGEEKPHVSYSLEDASDFSGKRVLVVGGGDTAVEAALLLEKASAAVTLSYRKSEFSRVKESNLSELKESSVRIVFNSTVKQINDKAVLIEVSEEEKSREELVEADNVFVFAGTVPNTEFLKKIGLEVNAVGKPVYNEKTFESSIPNLFVAGDLTRQPLVKNAVNTGYFIAKEIAERKTAATSSNSFV